MPLLTTPAPNRVELSDGGYLLFDRHQGQYRIAIYTRRVSKSETLVNALSRAMHKPTYDKKLKEIAAYIESSHGVMSLDD